MSSLRSIGKTCYERLQEIGFTLASRGMTSELARRDAERGRNRFRWFTPEEAAVAESLARLIVPSDDETPGIDEVGVLDAPAIEALDKLIAASPDRQLLYSRGLLAFEMWALRERHGAFVALPSDQQTALLSLAQHASESWDAAGSAAAKAWRRVRGFAQANPGPFFAGQLYPQIRNDCLQVFYTSRVSWVWLEYDGPPMDQGYPRVTEPR